MSAISTSVRVEQVTDRAQWNAFVERCPTGNITQTFEWAELGGNIAAESLRLGAFAGDELQAALLVIVDRAPLVRRPFFYVPRGPVVADPSSPALIALLDAAEREARRRGAFMLKVEPSVPDGDGAWLTALATYGFVRNPFATHPRRSWVLDVTPDEDTLLAGMKEKWRYNIRLAGRKGVTVREGQGEADVDTFYTLYQETATRDGIFIHGRRHYADFLHLYGERDAAVLLIAEYEGTPIAALIAARCGPTATYMFGASSNQHRNRMPNHLLQWTAIRWAKAHGCALYDFRAIAEVLEPDEDMYSLYTYKQGFGGHSLLTLETHDKAYSAPLYWVYRRALAMKRARVRRQQQRARQAEAHAKAAREKATEKATGKPAPEATVAQAVGESTPPGSTAER